LTRTCLTAFFTIISLAFFGQYSTDLKINDGETEEILHSPKKATIMSAALPGLGQVYNKKYWKVPIVYAGLGTCAYLIDFNNREFQTYKNALIAELDSDTLTVNNTGFSANQLDELQDTYRRWRDLSWICFGAVYLLNIIDANVDAHLFHFDVGDELGMSVLPYFSPSTRINTGVSLYLNF
jgi:hypothetical protein